MTFSDEWEAIYRAGQQHNSWPWSDVVSLVFRYVQGGVQGRRVLELGCGTGANAGFFAAMGADYSGIDGSAAGVAVVHKRFPAFAKNVVVGDFTVAFPSPGPYDVIVDRASVTHNSQRAIERTLQLVYENLRPGGCFIGVDWFSSQHSDKKFGKPAEDEHTLTGFESGQFKGCGRVHFSDKAHLCELFAAFEIVFMAEKTVHHLVPAGDRRMVTLEIVARKRQ